MPRLILLRHSKAAAVGAGGDDHGRPLTARGREEAAAAARAIAERGRPDCALVSDARRTRETFERCQAAFESPVACRFEPSLYLAAPATILDILNEVPAAVETLLVVGHNPGLGEVARILARGGEKARLADLETSFPTSSFASLALKGTWADVRSGGRLETYFTLAGRDPTRA